MAIVLDGLLGISGAASLVMTGGVNSARGNITQHATTMDLFALTSPDSLDGTGSAVTITACVDAPQAGATRKFYPIVATVLTHGATFDIAGNANLTAAAGDCWILEAKTVSTYRVTAVKEDGTAVVGAGVSPTIQTLTAGSGTYTTPANCVAIEVELVGGGGGGGGGSQGAASGGTGGAGGNSTFGALTSNGGGGGLNATLGVGGTASGGDVNIVGARGTCGGAGVNGAVQGTGGGGGASYFGGAGGGYYAVAGADAATNSGSGGGGGGCNATSAPYGGSGGASGGYVRKLTATPSATYAYAVGAAGTAGTAGTSGYAAGAGGSGLIIVREYY